MPSSFTSSIVRRPYNLHVMTMFAFQNNLCHPQYSHVTQKEFRSKQY